MSKSAKTPGIFSHCPFEGAVSTLSYRANVLAFRGYAKSFKAASVSEKKLVKISNIKHKYLHGSKQESKKRQPV